MNVGMVLGGLGDGPLGLAQGALRRLRSLRQRLPQRGDQELIALLVKRKRGSLAGAAHHAPGGG